MNQGASTASASYPATAFVGTTRSSPSAPMPARRSQTAATHAASGSKEASTSSTMTKSFSVPWPLVKRIMG
jgi:hypothetical protein